MAAAAPKRSKIPTATISGHGATGAPDGHGNSGGDGGNATASATAIHSAGDAFADVYSTGGGAHSSSYDSYNLSGWGAGFTGGAGGVASGATAYARGLNNAIARLQQSGGIGGNGFIGASGGAGASSTLTNAVSGTMPPFGPGWQPILTMRWRSRPSVEPGI